MNLSASSSLLLLSLLHDLLHNLLLLDQESANNTVLDTVGAARAAVCALDSLLWVRDLAVFAWAEGWDLHIMSISVCCTLFPFFCTDSHPPSCVQGTGKTYTCKLDSTVTTFWRSSLLLDVQVSEFTTWRLDDADLVALGVV